MRFLSTVLLGGLLCLNGCNVINPREAVPCYLEILPPTLILDDALYPIGPPDVWAYQYPNFTGAFQPPVKVPVINLDDKTFLFRGGVWENSDITFRKLYPFWRFDTLKLEKLEEGKTYTVRPEIRYYNDTVFIFPFKENFESAQVNFIPYNETDSIARLTRVSEGALKGGGCGLVRFAKDTTRFEAVSAQPFNLPQDGREIWLEISYKSNINFAASLVAVAGGSDPQIMLPIIPDAPYNPDEWSRAYINLTQMVNASTAGSTFKFYLRALSDGNARFIYFDDIRLLYFKTL